MEFVTAGAHFVTGQSGGTQTRSATHHVAQRIPGTSYLGRWARAGMSYSGRCVRALGRNESDESWTPTASHSTIQSSLLYIPNKIYMLSGGYRQIPLMKRRRLRLATRSGQCLSLLISLYSLRRSNTTSRRVADASLSCQTEHQVSR